MEASIGMVGDGFGTLSTAVNRKTHTPRFWQSGAKSIALFLALTVITSSAALARNEGDMPYESQASRGENGQGLKFSLGCQLTPTEDFLPLNSKETKSLKERAQEWLKGSSEELLNETRTHVPAHGNISNVAKGLTILNGPTWRTLEDLSPSTGEVYTRNIGAKQILDGEEAFFVRSCEKEETLKQKLGNFLAPAEGKIGETEALRLPIRVWMNPEQKARGVVVMVHGTTQQSGSFELFAKHLSSLGFKVISLDMRGHGRWYHTKDLKQGERANYTRTAKDLVVLLTHTRVRYPTLPLFCIGESVGAAVAVRAGTANPALFDGLCLVSPGSFPCVFNPVMVVKDFLIGITNVHRLMDVTRYITRYSSDDARVTHEMVTDPLSRTELTGLEILQTGYFIGTTPRFAKKLPDHVSVLIVQGKEDHIVRPSTTKTIFKKMPTKNKAFMEFPRFGHVLLGTSFLKPQVVTTISNWLVKEADVRPDRVIGLHQSNQAEMGP